MHSEQLNVQQIEGPGTKLIVAVLDKHGKDTTPKVVALINEFKVEHFTHFGLVSPRKSLLEKNLDILRRKSQESSTLIGYASSKPTDPSVELLQLDDAALVFQGRAYSPIPKTDVMEKLAEQPQHCESLLQTLIEKTDGDYAFFMLKNGWIGAGKRPHRCSTTLLWRKPRLGRSRHKPKSAMETRHRKPSLFSARKPWLCKPNRIPVQTNQNPKLHQAKTNNDRSSSQNTSTANRRIHQTPNK